MKACKNCKWYDFGGTFCDLCHDQWTSKMQELSLEMALNLENVYYEWLEIINQ